jgi:hypothetical protein
MATPIGPNPFHQVNQQMAKGPDAATLENLRQTGGTAAAQRKSEAPQSKEPETALELSQAAKRSLQDPPAAPRQNQAGPAAPSIPPAGPGADSADKVQARLAAAKLAAYDDPDTVYQRVLEDIPEANAEAAERVVNAQMKQSVKKMSDLKSGPEAEQAGKMEMRQAKFSGPLDICDSQTDRSLPLVLDIPDEMTEMAARAAAEALASGELEQEGFLRDADR